MSAAVLLGLLLGRDYLRRVRSKPALVGFHLLLGAGSLEVTVMLLRGAPSGDVVPAGPLLQLAAGLVAFALFSGLIAPMIGRRSRGTMNVALSVHVTAATIGFVLCLVWFVRALW
jgi:hypothetical protein